jgi:ferrochelatase
LADKATGILLLNLGGPDSLEAVRPFLFNLFSDRDIIRLGPSFLQRPLAWLISTRRTKKTQAAYRLIGGYSPISRITHEQARALEDSLRQMGNYRVYVGMRYWHPFIGDVIKKMHEDGLSRFIALSLYPHYSVATTGSAYSEVKKYLATYSLECDFTGPWYDNAYYINALTHVIKKSADPNCRRMNILYSAHSLPQSFIEHGDPYADHISATIFLVNSTLSKEGFGINSFVSYQSRSGPVKWLEPSTDEMIVELGKKGIGELLVVPISFVSDHIETLYEIDILYSELAKKRGITLKRVESLNSSPLFIEALKDIVLKCTQ